MENSNEKQQLVQNMPYAGFRIRLLAYLIDGFIMLVVTTILLFCVMAFCQILAGSDVVDKFRQIATTAHYKATGQEGSALIYAYIFYALIFISGMAYSVGFPASKYMGTPGKIALGLVITDKFGQRISFWRSLARNYFYVIICGLVTICIYRAFSLLIYFVGYLMVGLDDRKRGLHDHICGTFVIYKFATSGDPYEKFFDA